MIRQAGEQDAAALFSLQTAAPGMPPWTEIHWLELLHSDAVVLIAEMDGVAAGCAVVSMVRIPGETTAELEAIVVTAKYRRTGLGEAMMREMMATVQAEGAVRLLLEVRTGNLPAISLYQKLGFEKEGLRRRYYRDPVEDAVLMSVRFPQEAVAPEKRQE
ncbi:ribosomal protein S18-alanine N-acetyltransferase [Terriglobus tenax]|uniref:ribosomal protein S18-alanine N-acetyltransferase n=1 Tax=Terriglobus tenax TaxID=1111115 RepID=UPI0021DF7576|nr:ribosomal protein S18-alanine N-acetyltransferase [Terriglobus tenax]